MPTALPPVPGKNPNEVIEMPYRQIFAATIGLPILAGVVSWVLFGAARPGGRDAIFPAVLSVVLGMSLGPVLVIVWKPRPLKQWPMLLLGAQGISLFGVLGLVVALYSATHPDKATFGVVVLVSFIGVLVVQTRLYAAGLRGTTADSNGSAGSDDHRP